MTGSLLSTARPIWKHTAVVINARYPICYTTPPCPRHSAELRQAWHQLFRTILSTHLRDAHNRSQVTPP